MKTLAWCAGVLVGLIPVAACDASRQLPGTSPSPPPAAITYTLSGHVFEVLPGHRVPAADISLTAVVETESGCDRPCIRRVDITYRSTSSGPDGRYHFPELPRGSAIVVAYSNTYQQVCGAFATLTATTQLDVEVTSRDNPQPSPTMPPLRLTGVVYETTPAGRVGVGGALVAFDWHNDGPFFQVYADADGRFSACGIPANRPLLVEAWQQGFDGPSAWRQFAADTTLDFELTRLSGGDTPGR